MRTTLFIALLSSGISCALAWDPLVRDYSREANDAAYSASLTMGENLSRSIAHAASLSSDHAQPSYQSQLSKWSMERNDPTRLSSQAEAAASQDAANSKTLGPHTTTAIFMPGAESGGYISAIGSEGETTTYVVARPNGNMGPYGYWVDMFSDVCVGTKASGCGQVTQPYVTMTVGPTTVAWEITYGGMAVSDVAGGLKQAPSWIPTETFTGSCSYTSIPAVSPSDFILDHVMANTDIAALPDDNFPTRTAICTADQEIWLKYGVYPTGTGKPFGQSTYTLIDKGHQAWDTKVLLENYKPWSPEEVAKTTKGAEQIKFESSMKSEFEAYGFDQYGSLGNHYATRLFMPGVSAGSWVSAGENRGGGGSGRWAVGDAGTDPEKLNKHYFDIQGDSAKWGFRQYTATTYSNGGYDGAASSEDFTAECKFESKAAKSPLGACAMQTLAYSDIPAEALPTRKAVCTAHPEMMLPKSGRFTGAGDHDAKQEYTLTEGEDLDAWWPLVTVVRVHETDIPANACVTRTSKQTSASSTSTAAQTGSGVRPLGPQATGGSNGTAQEALALSGAGQVKEVTAWVRVVVGAVAMAAVVV